MKLRGIGWWVAKFLLHSSKNHVLLLFFFFLLSFLSFFCLIVVKYLNLVSSLLCNMHVIWTPLHMDKAYLHIIYIESKGVTYRSPSSLSLVCVGVSLNIFVNAFYSVFEFSSFFVTSLLYQGRFSHQWVLLLLNLLIQGSLWRLVMSMAYFLSYILL